MEKAGSGAGRVGRFGKAFMQGAVYRGYGWVIVPGLIGAGLWGIWDFTKGRLPVIVIVAIAGAALALALGLREVPGWVSRKYPAAEDRERIYKYVFLGCLGALAVMQVMMLTAGMSEPRNDLSYICTAAKSHVLGGAGRIYENLPPEKQHYFAVYPNNHALYMIVYGVYKLEYLLTGHFYDLPLQIINVVGMDISYVLACRCARMLFPPEKAMLSAVKGLMFTPLITYAGVFYTDTMGMLPLTAAVYLYIRRLQKGGGRRLLIGAAVLLGIAYKLKGSAGIFLVALLLDTVVKGGSLKKRAADILTVIVAFLGVCVILSRAGTALLHITPEESEEYRFPAVHWVMMGADGRGGFNKADFQYTVSFPGQDSKTSADLSRLGDKLREQGAAGFCKHLAWKLSYTWEDPTFMASYYTENPILISIPVLALSMISYFTLLFSLRLSLIAPPPEGTGSNTFVLPLTMLGITLFLLIWEARCRYLISFFLFFVVG